LVSVVSWFDHHYLTYHHFNIILRIRCGFFGYMWGFSGYKIDSLSHIKWIKDAILYFPDLVTKAKRKNFTLVVTDEWNKFLENIWVGEINNIKKEKKFESFRVELFIHIFFYGRAFVSVEEAFFISHVVQVNKHCIFFWNFRFIIYLFYEIKYNLWNTHKLLYIFLRLTLSFNFMFILCVCSQ
jgi:hypothetical protein